MEIMMMSKEKSEARPLFSGFRILRDVKKMLLAPGEFYRNLPEKHGMMDAFLFLLSCTMIFSILAAFFASEQKMLFALIYFSNAALMPVFMSLALYVAALFICKGVFAYGTLFRVATYANVTCLLAWIPGMAWATGIWSFYLMGLGMIKAGRIGKWHALSVILAGGGLMLLLIQIIYPVLGGLKNGS
ncbi:MAG: YIP1 family protein [Pseudomonadota bacterium]